MEFLAALNLVPHSVKCEVWKRQKNTKSQFGNWWERLHSQVSYFQPVSAICVYLMCTVTIMHL